MLFCWWCDAAEGVKVGEDPDIFAFTEALLCCVDSTLKERRDREQGLGFCRNLGSKGVCSGHASGNSEGKFERMGEVKLRGC